MLLHFSASNRIVMFVHLCPMLLTCARVNTHISRAVDITPLKSEALFTHVFVTLSTGYVPIFNPAISSRELRHSKAFTEHLTTVR